ncbi:hypothetical protein DJ010_09395 [Nocardioides silvaticus]|uniref:NAD(P)H nitroreductase n=1 Tax=Nocardioides silvaticus TaxID=2201891 RepID=A0A316TV29_9ACTN|nr:hypothetical protein [Nocardioides silvaticus]PWN03316.1 hypothetical protein DJ010_09395 [Nocardioides silvaticus]
MLLVERLVELACLAPSVHNTQPWRWHAVGDRLFLHADRSRQLVHEDPSGRNLVISCGAALDHLRFAARALGLTADITRFPDGPRSDLIAVVDLRHGLPSPTAAEDIALLRQRCTDRRRFTSWPVHALAREVLVAAARRRGALAVAVTEPGQRIELELLSRRAHHLRSLNRAALEEQASWVGPGRPTDGIPSSVLPDQVGPAPTRFGPGTLTEERAVVESTDGMIVLGGRDDDRAGWLRTGEALSSLWLRATRDGLSVVPLSLPVEVPSVRGELTAALEEPNVVPHILLRIGWQAIGRSELPRTPRRPVADVLVVGEDAGTSSRGTSSAV